MMSMKRVVTVILMSCLLSGVFSVNVQAAEKIPAAVSQDRQAEQKSKEEKKVLASSAMKARKEPAYTKSELRLMSAIIYCEAGNEPYAGKKAVGIVVMNRKKSKDFPDTIKEVIYQKGQFQPTRNGSMKKALKAYDQGKFETKEYKACVKAAKEALKGDTKVTVKGKTRNMKSYLFFSQYVKGCRLKIGGHQFK